MNESPLDELQRYGRGIIYPTTKDLVYQWMQHNGAPQHVIDKLATLPTRVAGPHEVLIALRRIPARGPVEHPSTGRHPSY